MKMAIARKYRSITTLNSVLKTSLKNLRMNDKISTCFQSKSICLNYFLKLSLSFSSLYRSNTPYFSWFHDTDTHFTEKLRNS